MRALIYTNNEQEYQLLRKITEEEIDGIIVSQVHPILTTVTGRPSGERSGTRRDGRKTAQGMWK